MPRGPLGDKPKMLRPYFFHGLDLGYEGDGEARATCPFCGGEDKFFVSQQNGMFDCKTCPAQGNHYDWIRQLYDTSATYFSGTKDLELVAAERKIPVEALQRWGLVKSAIDQEWMLPAYGPAKIVNGEKKPPEVNNLYRWSLMGGKRRLLTTAEMDHYLFGLQHWDDDKPNAIINEGPWDAIPLEHYLMRAMPNEAGDGWILSSSGGAFRYTNVVALPGCEQFQEAWASRFNGKNVTLFGDSDYPKHYGKNHERAGQLMTHKDGRKMVPGYDGMRRTARLLRPHAATIRIVQWGAEGYDASLKDGYDVRDKLNS